MWRGKTSVSKLFMEGTQPFAETFTTVAAILATVK